MVHTEVRYGMLLLSANITMDIKSTLATNTMPTPRSEWHMCGFMIDDFLRCRVTRTSVHFGLKCTMIITGWTDSL